MLLFTGDDIQRIKRKARQNPEMLEILRRKTDFFFQYGVKVPVGKQSTWVMNFMCPEDSAKLIYDYAQQFEFTCPVCGKVYTGDYYGGAWWRYTVEKTVDNGFYCAMLWLITEEEKYKSVAAEVLERFANNYAGYELHGGIPYNNPGMISSQNLCEALTLRSLVMTFDVLSDFMPQKWNDMVVQKLIEPSAQVMMEQRMSQLHNHEVVIDSTLSVIGLVLGRQDILDFGLYSKYGLKYQMENGVLEDGFWFEGTVHYHYFALWACMIFEKFAKDTKHSMRRLGIYEKMYAMPLRIMKWNYTLPCLGDGSGEGTLEELAMYYEFPYTLLKTKEIAQLLNTVYSRTERSGIEALLYGADEIEATELLKPGDYHDNQASGLTVLHGAGNQYLLFKHGKFGGEHDHYDKLGLHYSVGDQDVFADFGTVGYNAPHHYPYFKNTFTHNTVCINGVNQPPADGKTIDYLPGKNGTFVQGYAGWTGALPDRDSLTIVQWDEEAYRGVEMYRALLFQDAYILEAFLVKGAQGKTVDWVIHPKGTCSLPAQPWTTQSVGNSKPQTFLSAARRIPNAGVTHSQWAQPAGTLHLWSGCNQEGGILYADGPDNPPSQKLTYLIHRVVPGQGDVIFANVICFSRNQPVPADVSIHIDGNSVRIRLTVDGKKHEHAFVVGEPQPDASVR